MRNAFADELTKLGTEDARVVMLSGDIGNRLFDKFKDKHPSRFFNCGVAEANMMGVAAGMAMNGLRPVAYTITPFVTTRCLEQIRTDVCYHEAPVTIVAVGAGLAYSGLGPTHHACEDISFLRSIPNMVVICPGDAFEVRGALRAALQQDRPVYIRMGKKGEPVVHKGPIADFAIGKAITISEGSDVCLLSTGNMLPEAIEAAHKLQGQGHLGRGRQLPHRQAARRRLPAERVRDVQAGRDHRGAFTDRRLWLGRLRMARRHRNAAQEIPALRHARQLSSKNPASRNMPARCWA